MSQPTPEQRYEEQLRAAHGSGGIAEYLLHRAKPHLPPWLAGIGTGLASLPAHFYWSGSAAATAGLTLVSVALTGTTWWAGKTTTAQRRLHSAITVAASSSWFTAAAIAGPDSGPLPGLYFMGAPALALSWNIRQILRRNPEGGISADGGLLEKVGLAKAQITRSTVSPNKATFDLQLPRGELTQDDASKALPLLASALDVSKNAVRLTHDPDSASRVQLTVVPHDLLKNTVPCPGPSHPGGSIADPVHVGIYEDGTEAVMYFPGDPKAGRNAMHLLVMGMTGSGKSEGGLTALAEILTRRDVTVWASDPAKADQTLGPLLPAIDWAALDMKSTKAMVEALNAVIPARTRWLAKYGYKQWEPACAKTQADGSPGMPYLIGWFEEAAKTIRETDDDVFTGIAQEARSAGVSLVISLQRASGNQVSTDTRASLGSSWVYGLRNDRDATFALDDDVLDAGAAPHAWKDKKPGYCYLVANGIPETFWATPARSYLTAREYLDWVVLAFDATRAAGDPITAEAASKAAGRLYAKRTRYPIPGADNAPTTETAMIDPSPYDQDLDAEDFDDQDLDEPDTDDDHDEDLDAIDPEAELPEPSGVIQLAERPSAKQKVDLTPAQARQAMAEMLDEFEAEGRTIVRPSDFMEHCDRHGRSRPWVSSQVANFVMAGRLAETNETGVYRIIREDEAA
ncbi:plasmid transfer protein TraB [Streptomyces tirandamycinicus]|uniref:Sporulation protein SsgA n=1 Tax=Streptomyces tirandamycinicus TaxID=2174846 RepID=A0A2S1SVH8_9ACTN|nr:plasmid transfer protein TraB [Streptomyces tirandamycinicus]AWI30414.1 sporulation protein SsgA [Streptomyces tirandamycinicus]